MFIKQLYTGCLSEAAYYIESNGEAAVIDPIRDIDPYLDLANTRKAIVKYIFETHFHADFVSGHMDLSKATGAPVIYGPQTETKLPVHIAKDGERFQLGELSIEVLHTPGHTLESSCYLLKDKNGKDHCVFTGDTLFAGDVGRPDLAQKENEITTEDLAGMMYDSIHSKLFPLSDEVIVYPAHGPGSACGKNLGPNTQSTIGEEKRTNYAMKASSKEEFIREVTKGIPSPPHYFPVNAMINKEGYESLSEILKQGLRSLSVEEFKTKMNDDVIILDSRPADIFTSGFVPGSINIGLEGRFAEWAGSLLPFDKPILLITEPGKEKESIIRLARVGFNKMAGYLKGDFEAWKKAGEEINMIINVEPHELMLDIPFDKNLLILDVRKPAEYADGHLKDAVNIPLDKLTDSGNLGDLEDHYNIYIHCAAGYRSVIAASLLKRRGIHNLRNVSGGWEKISAIQNVEIVKEAAILN
ncbi:MAG: MBL fold metallo-hydrolase [Chitinophagales bacterium]|nr:MBL fold metallo-hydrolase [Chitinophagales bacterium]